MALPTIFVRVGAAGTQISNVQEFSFNKGRQTLSDPIGAGRGVIRGRRPDLLPTISVGDYVRIDITTLGSAFYWGRVTDLTIEYGPVAALDTWTLNVEDTLATLGRCAASFSWSAGSTTGTAVQALCTGAGVSLTDYGMSSPCSAQVLINENALEVFSRLMTQEQGFYQAGGADGTLEVWGKAFSSSINTYDVSDDGTGSNPVKYDNLQFAGIADNYADKVIVEAAGLAQQSAGIGNYSTTIQTYNQTTAQAVDLANYLLGVYDAQVQNVSSVSARWQPNSGVALQRLTTFVTAPVQLRIKFRGNTYFGIVIGCDVSGTLDDIRFTYYLAAPPFFTMFTLDSSSFGILNTNKLGF